MSWTLFTYDWDDDGCCRCCRYLTALEGAEASLPLLIVGSHLLEVIGTSVEEKKLATTRQYLIDMLIKVSLELTHWLNVGFGAYPLAKRWVWSLPIG